VVTAFLLPGKAAGFIDSNEKEKGQESEDSYGCNRISVSQTNTHTHTRFCINSSRPESLVYHNQQIVFTLLIGLYI